MLDKCRFCGKRPDSIVSISHTHGKNRVYIKCRNLKCEVRPNVSALSEEMANSFWRTINNPDLSG